MTYANMKACIQKIFGDPSGDGNGNTPSVKSEPVFQSDHSEDVNFTSGYRSGWRSQNRGVRSRGYMYNRSQQGRPGYGKNPVDKDGNLFRCYKCGKPGHFARSCTFRNGEDETKTEQVKMVITLLNVKSDKNMEGLVGECFGKALLDSGCTKTVW